MTAETQTILERALALPEEERALLVERLLESLPADVGEVSDEELTAELDRRFAEYQNDPSTGVLWDDIKRKR